MGEGKPRLTETALVPSNLLLFAENSKLSARVDPEKTLQRGTIRVVESDNTGRKSHDDCQLVHPLEEYDPETEVRLASQPSYPFEYSIAGVASVEEVAALYDGDTESAEDERDFDGGTAPDNRVFILEGIQLKYGSRDLWACAL